ncbi:MAG TPA: hypothetical protein VF807_08590 [Ktedonobacterales bacterium]
MATRKSHQLQVRCGQMSAVMLTLLALLVMLPGCGTAVHSSARAQAQPTAPVEPIDITGVADGIQFHTPQELCGAPWPVAEVIVASVNPSTWNTTDGLRPVGVGERDIVNKGYMIYTPMTLAQIAVLHDPKNSLQVMPEIVTLGGKVGQDQIAIAPYPHLQAGGHYIITLVPALDNLVTKNPPRRSIVSQAFPIDAQGNVMLRQQVIEQGQISQYELKVSLASLKQQLAACA